MAEQLTPAQKAAETRAANKLAAEQKAAADLAAAEESEDEVVRAEDSGSDETPVADSKPVQLIAIKGTLTNGVTMEQYTTVQPLAPREGIQHWEQMQINAGLLRIVG